MGLTKRTLLAAAASLATLAAASAADYDPPIHVEQAAEYVPVEVGSGWYLRGDVGYIFNASIGEVDYRTYDSGTYTSRSFDRHDISPDFSWGGGAGYRFTDYFRADATVEGYRASFSGSTSSAESCLPLDAAYDGTSCRSTNGSEASVISVMANGYVDLGTYIGITPYVGAGVGYSYVSWDGLNSNYYCVDGASSCPTTGVEYSTSHGGEDGWRLTYAFMAGFAYDLTQNFKLDLGYKYRQIDGGDMFGWDSASAADGASGVQGKSGSLDSHEFKVGLRYELW